MAGGPLLVFLCVTLVDKPDLTSADYFHILTFWLNLVMGFLIIPQQPYWLAVVWLTLSILFFLPMLNLPFYATGYSQMGNSISSQGYLAVLNSNSNNVDDEEKQDLTLGNTSNNENDHHSTLDIFQYAQLYAKRKSLCMFLAIAFPLFSVNYFFAMTQLIGPAETIAIFQLLSIITKGYFATICMDIHVDGLSLIQQTAREKEQVNETRGSFLKYIFHEVRTPLSTINLGIEILSNNEHMTENDQQALEMMKGAASFVQETLDSVLDLQKIEEGTFILDFQSFRISESITKVIHAYRGEATVKNIHLASNISADVIQTQLLGDCHRIEIAVGNLLSNAIKFSDNHTTVTVNITCDIQSNTTPQFQRHISSCLVKVSVIDEGCGISRENLKSLLGTSLMNQFHRPDLLQAGQGSGLGLSLSKKIVHLHGGTMNAQSIIGHGSTFSFIIPFQIDCSTFVRTESESMSLEKLRSVDSIGTSGNCFNNDRPISWLPVRQSTSSRENDNNSEYKCDLHSEASIFALQSSNSLDIFDSTKTNVFLSATAATINVETSNPLLAVHEYVSDSHDTTTTLLGKRAVEKDIRMSQLSSASVISSSSELNNSNHHFAYDFGTSGVLLVDDISSTRKMLTMLFKKRGIDSCQAGDGQEALDTVFRGIDTITKLIFMDNLMPTMNGVDATRALRKAGYKYLIIAVTGNVLDDDIEQFLQAGADFVIPKPLKTTKLDNLLRFIQLHVDGSLSRYPKEVLVEKGAYFAWQRRR